MSIFNVYTVLISTTLRTMIVSSIVYPALCTTKENNNNISYFIDIFHSLFVLYAYVITVYFHKQKIYSKESFKCYVCPMLACIT